MFMFSKIRSSYIKLIHLITWHWVHDSFSLFITYNSSNRSICWLSLAQRQNNMRRMVKSTAEKHGRRWKQEKTYSLQVREDSDTTSTLDRKTALWVEMRQDRHVEYWAIFLSACSFNRTSCSFPCSALLASLSRSTALICSLAHSLAPELMKELFMHFKW